MPDQKRLLELALMGLEAERQRFDEEIADIQDETPSLNRAAVKAMWDKCFQAAKRAAEAEMDRRCLSRSLTWNEVFEADYEVK